jgi:hypothetical protein
MYICQSLNRFAQTPPWRVVGKCVDVTKSLISLWITNAGGGKMSVDSASAEEFPPIG